MKKKGDNGARAHSREFVPLPSFMISAIKFGWHPWGLNQVEDVWSGLLC